MKSILYKEEIEDLKPRLIKEEINIFNNSEKCKETVEYIKKYYNSCRLDFINVSLNEMEKATDKSIEMLIERILELVEDEDLSMLKLSSQQFVNRCVEVYKDLSLGKRLIASVSSYLLRTKHYDDCILIAKEYIRNLKDYVFDKKKDSLFLTPDDCLFFNMCMAMYIQGKYDEISNEEESKLISCDILNKYDNFMDYFFLKESPQTELVFDEDDNFKPEDILKEIESGVSTPEEIFKIDDKIMYERERKYKDYIESYRNEDFDEEELIHFLMFNNNVSYNYVRNLRFYNKV